MDLDTGSAAMLRCENSAGRPITQDPHSLAIFWREFQGSAAVDELGRPLILFHGTDAPEDFSEFRPASFFSTSSSEASAYAFPKDFATRARSSGKYMLASGEIHAGRYVEYAGSLCDISAPVPGEVYATDLGVFQYREKGRWNIFCDLVVDYDAEEGERLRVVTGDANGEARAVVDDYEAFLAENFPGGDGGRVIPVYVLMKNPKWLEPLEANRLGIRLGASEADIADTVDRYKALGYDGIITISDEASMFPEVARSLGHVPKHFIPFDPNQVKSAVGNPGIFDWSRPHITDGIEALPGHKRIHSTSNAVSADETSNGSLRKSPRP